MAVTFMGKPMDVIWSLLSHLLTFVAGIFARSVAPLAVNWVQRHLVFLIARSKLKIAASGRIAGDWHHTWYAKGSTNWPDENECSVTLSAIGRNFAGIWIYRNMAWFVRGEIGDDNIVTGTWGDLEKNGYRGTWIGKVDLNRKSIIGWYLGTSNRYPTGAGEWIWWRKGSSKPALPDILVQTALREPQN
jgi:hypothetical protein